MSQFPNELLVVVGGNALSGLLMLVGGLFVFFQNWRGKVNRLFFFLTISTLAYTIFFIIASLQTGYAAAYSWWFLNIFDVFIPMAIVHFVLTVAERDRQWRWFIIATYVTGFIIFAVAWIEPHWFLPAVAPKLYFPYYLVGGWWYAVMLVHFLLPPVIAAANLILAYRDSFGLARKRLEYIIFMLLVGYAIGPLNFLLVFNIPVDPIYGMFVGFYLLPIAYGIYATDLLDIRIVVRRTLYYAVGIGAIAAFLATLTLLSNFLASTVPGLQFWMLPLAVGTIAFIIGRSVWYETRETERLKYEFLTVATHKLRTPLTHIHWVVPELLVEAGDNQKMREGLRRIDDANNRLIELTNVLLEAAHEHTSFGYEKVAFDLVQAAHESLDRFKHQIEEKKLKITEDFSNAPKALGDPRRITSVIDVFIENSVVYTPVEGQITISVGPYQKGVRFTVSDTGIGIKHEDRERIFSTFFRTEAAKTADTEGVGIGLALSKQVIEKMGGAIGMESGGDGKGSMFWFTLPAAKEK